MDYVFGSDEWMAYARKTIFSAPLYPKPTGQENFAQLWQIFLRNRRNKIVDEIINSRKGV